MTRFFRKQSVIAMIWDFDKTLSPHYMQEPLFRHYGVDAASFWSGANALPAAYHKAGCHHIGHDAVYLNHLLRAIRHGEMPDLSNAKLRELGKGISFFLAYPMPFSAGARMSATIRPGLLRTSNSNIMSFPMDFAN